MAEDFIMLMLEGLQRNLTKTDHLSKEEVIGYVALDVKNLIAERTREQEYIQKIKAAAKDVAEAFAKCSG